MGKRRPRRQSDAHVFGLPGHGNDQCNKNPRCRNRESRGPPRLGGGRVAAEGGAQCPPRKLAIAGEQCGRQRDDEKHGDSDAERETAGAFDPR